MLGRLVSPSEDTRSGGSFEYDFSIADPKPRSLTQADDYPVVFLEKLPNPLLASLTHMPRFGVWIEIVRIEIERDEGQGIE